MSMIDCASTIMLIVIIDHSPGYSHLEMKRFSMCITSYIITSAATLYVRPVIMANLIYNQEENVFLHRYV